jgi:hypothetical protein
MGGWGLGNKQNPKTENPKPKPYFGIGDGDGEQVKPQTENPEPKPYSQPGPFSRRSRLRTMSDSDSVITR